MVSVALLFNLERHRCCFCLFVILFCVCLFVCLICVLFPSCLLFSFIAEVLEGVHFMGQFCQNIILKIHLIARLKNKAIFPYDHFKGSVKTYEF